MYMQFLKRLETLETVVRDLSIQHVREWSEQNSQLLLRASLTLAIVLASAIFALRPSLITLLLVVGLGGALILMRWPLLGLAGVIIGGLVVPVGIGTGSESEINPPMLLLILLLGIAFLQVVWRREIRWAASRTILPLMAFLGVAFISFGVGQLPWFYTGSAPIRAQIGGLAIFVLSAGAFLLTSHLVKDVRWLERFTWILLSLGAVYIVGQIVPPLWNLAGKLYLVGAVGSLFWLWLVALAFSQAVFNRQLRRFWRFALIALVVTTMYIAMIRNQGWTSGWAPALVAIIVIIIVGAPRIGIPITLLGAAAALLNSRIVSNLLNAGDNAYSELTRLQAWNILFQIIKSSPILGLGPANYYFYTPLFSILGYYVKFNSHNNYVDLVAETGILGLACFLWFSFEVGRVGWQLRARVPDGFARAYVYGALGGLVGTLVAGLLGDWILPFVYNIGLAGFRASVLAWIFIGGLVALETMARTNGQLADLGPKA
jgi:O-antigen ligase